MSAANSPRRIISRKVSRLSSTRASITTSGKRAVGSGPARTSGKACELVRDELGSLAGACRRGSLLPGAGPSKLEKLALEPRSRRRAVDGLDRTSRRHCALGTGLRRHRADRSGRCWRVPTERSSLDPNEVSCHRYADGVERIIGGGSRKFAAEPSGPATKAGSGWTAAD